MRTPPFLLLLLLIPVLPIAACSSSPSNSSPNSSARETAEEEPLPEDVPNITGEQVKVEWRNLNPARQDPAMGLINRSSPELAKLYRDPKAYAHIKPVEDKDMGVILTALEQIGYFDYATEGVRLEDLAMGDGHGVVALTRGDRSWALVFRRGQGESQLPTVYRNSKMVVLEFHRQTLWFVPTKSQETFQIPSHKYPKR